MKNLAILILGAASLASIVGCERKTETIETPFGTKQTTTTKTPGTETIKTYESNKHEEKPNGADVKVRINREEGVKVDVTKKKVSP